MRLTILRKALCAAALVALAQWFFYFEEPGGTLGAFALAWIGGLLLTVPALRRPGPAAVLALGAALGGALIDDPNPLAWLLLWTAIASAVLLARHRFDNAARWAVRLFAFGLIGLVSPIRDLFRLARRMIPGRLGALAATLALPIGGALVFGALFAVANPVIGSVLGRIEIPSFWSASFHLLFWGAVLATVWPSLRPRSLRLDGVPPVTVAALRLPVATLILSLVTFNGIFAVQNALDIAFLWSGAPLPAGVTLASYAHQGAYTLIATALLAAAFVLVALSPGTPAAISRTVQRLVLLWVAQNVLLVASSILRLIDYIEAYSLTELRIAALLWMALVAVGLVLIALRLIRAKSAAWLLNANAAAAAAVLLGSSTVDFGAVAARWNVDHARRGDQLDLCYLHRLGSSALLPLIDLEQRAGGPELRDRVRYLRLDAMADLRADQADWHSWTWRNARRLAAAEALADVMPSTVRAAPNGRDCDGALVPPPPPQPAPPLTDRARP